MESEKLKSCPFCGADAQIEHDSDHHGAWFNLGCSRHWGSDLVDPDHACIGGRVFYTESETPEAEAITAWNTRAPAEPTEWRDIETAPKDGTAFFVWADGYEWPEVIKWFDYDEEDREELGEDGYFAYAEQLLAEACDPIDLAEFSHWRPLPAPPGTTRAPADLRSALEAEAIERAALERALDRIDWPAIHAFEDELRKGQDIYEDAGGFMARAIKALFGIKPTDPVTAYRDAAAALVAALAPTTGDVS